MVTAKRILRILREVDDRETFLHSFLRDGLGWPIPLSRPLGDGFDAELDAADHCAGSSSSLSSSALTSSSSCGPTLSASVCFRPIFFTGPAPEWRVTLVEFTNGTQSADGARNRFNDWRRTVCRRFRNDGNRFRNGGHLVFCTADWQAFTFALLDGPSTDGVLTDGLTGGGHSLWIECDSHTTAKTDHILGEFLRKLQWPDSTEPCGWPTDPGGWSRHWRRTFDKRNLRQRFLRGCRRNRHAGSDPVSLEEFVLKQIRNSADSTSILPTAETGFVGVPSSQNVAQPSVASESGMTKQLCAFVERFPFTLHEDTSRETFLAIGPGILAELHETGCGRSNETPETGRRKRIGSYFTPPVIADFMAREALREYLSDRLAKGSRRRREDGREILQTLLTLPPCEVWNDTEQGILREWISFEDAALIRRTLWDCRICDPAVGAGSLLLSICREMTSVLKKLAPILCEHPQDILAESEFTLMKRILESCLYGIDLDAAALRICKLRLSLMLLESLRNEEFVTVNSVKTRQDGIPNLDRQFVCADALRDVAFSALPRSTAARQTASASDLQGRFFTERNGFDIVLANPPYRSFGLRGNKNSDLEWAERIRREFPESAEYKISLSSLFFELGLNISGEGGVLCYLTPDSFLLGRYFSKLRKMLLERSRIRRLVTFADDFWRSAVVGRPTISLLQKVSSTETEIAESDAAVQAVLIGGQHSATTHATRQLLICQQSFREAVHCHFRLFFSARARDFASMMESQNRPLGSLARITTGIRSRCGQRNVVAEKRRGDDWKRGLVSGSQVQPFRVNWRGHYLHLDRELLFAGGWDAALIERPKILIRQTGDSLIAAVDTGKHYHLNNIHALIPFKADVSLPFLCAVLNSRVMNRYYHLITLEKGRVLAQIDIDTLNRLPIGFASDELRERIEQLSLRSDVPAVKEELESLIENCYDPDGRFLDYLTDDDLYPPE